MHNRFPLQSDSDSSIQVAQKNKLEVPADNCFCCFPSIPNRHIQENVIPKEERAAQGVRETTKESQVAEIARKVFKGSGKCTAKAAESKGSGMLTPCELLAHWSKGIRYQLAK